VNRSDIGTSKRLLGRINPLQLNFSLLVIQILRQRTKRTIAEQQIDLLERKLICFLCPC
jgi:hypothetical protein